MSDPGIAYRSREELKDARKQDPLIVLKDRMIELKINTEDELKTMEKEIRAHVNAEAEVALKMDDPPPTQNTLFQDIYVRGAEPPYMRGTTADKTYYYAH